MPKRRRWPTLVFAVPIYGPRCALLGIEDTQPSLRLWMELHKHYTLYWIADVHGSKVCVVGRTSANVYQANDGTAKVSLDLLAEDVEFLDPKGGR